MGPVDEYNPAIAVQVTSQFRDVLFCRDSGHVCGAYLVMCFVCGIYNIAFLKCVPYQQVMLARRLLQTSSLNAVATCVLSI